MMTMGVLGAEREGLGRKEVRWKSRQARLTGVDPGASSSNTSSPLHSSIERVCSALDTRTHTPSCFSPHRPVASSPIASPHLTELFTSGFSAGPSLPRQQDSVDVGPAAVSTSCSFLRAPCLDRAKKKKLTRDRIFNVIFKRDKV